MPCKFVGEGLAPPEYKHFKINEVGRRGQDCKQLCKMIVYSFVLVQDNAFGSRTERSGERLPKAARVSI